MRNSVIVTGGYGYIGSHTIIELLANEFKPLSIDNFSRSSPKVAECIKKVSGYDAYNYNLDLCDSLALSQVFSKLNGVSGLIHFAAFKSVPESVANPEVYYRNNLISLLNVLDICIKYRVSSVVFSSSCSVYGDVSNLPVSEQTPFSEPKSSYAATKMMGERIAGDICRAHGINLMCLRYFNPVGAHPSGMIGEMPVQKPDNLVPVITQTAIGRRENMTVFGGDLNTRDGSCIRDFVHVMDIASAHVLALKYLQSHSNVFETINLGTGTGVSVFEAIRAFEDVAGQKLNYSVGAPRDGDVVEIYSDVSKARSVLGWEPKYGINDMMHSAWKWELELSKETGLIT